MPRERPIEDTKSESFSRCWTKKLRNSQMDFRRISEQDQVEKRKAMNLVEQVSYVPGRSQDCPLLLRDAASGGQNIEMFHGGVEGGGRQGWRKDREGPPLASGCDMRRRSEPFDNVSIAALGLPAHNQGERGTSATRYTHESVSTGLDLSS